MQTELGETWAADFDKAQMRDLISRAITRADACFEVARDCVDFKVKLALISDAGDFRQMASTMAKVIGDPPPQSLTAKWAHRQTRDPLILTEVIRSVS